MQYTIYDSAVNGHYGWHQDYGTQKPVVPRKLSVVVQLSDPAEYEGGDLELFNIKQYPIKEEIRKQGTAFFFPGFIEHQANVVTKGKRYSLAAWFEGPKFV